ncbi:MAG: hypothetical protein M3R48_00910 [Candidatus Dormibacteraeota bacterium]|nr:hypothetical protein [Candidatus Dormibacteraeota bacterium]
MTLTVQIGSDVAADPRFTASSLSACDEPVRRYFTHAIAEGTALNPGVTLLMKGRIRVGVWLPFTARQHCDGSSFMWRAQVPPRARLLTVTDRYSAGRASMEGRLLTALRLFHSDDQNTIRSAAGRAVVEGIMAPIGLLPGPTRIWHSESASHIVAKVALGPEQVALHLTINGEGGVRSVRTERWGNAEQKAFAYIPFGGDVLSEQRFGDLVLPARISVGWWYGTARFHPFFEAEVIDARPLDQSPGRKHPAATTADAGRPPGQPWKGS